MCLLMHGNANVLKIPISAEKKAVTFFSIPPYLSCFKHSFNSMHIAKGNLISVLLSLCHSQICGDLKGLGRTALFTPFRLHAI